MTEYIQPKWNVPLQCPECHQLLEKEHEAYRCPSGHVGVNLLENEFSVLHGPKGGVRPLQYGGTFPEGILWEKVTDRCKELVYIAAEGEREADRMPLSHYLEARGRTLAIVSLKELNTFKLDRRTPIIFSSRINRRDKRKIVCRYVGQPVYAYSPGTVIRSDLPRILRQRFSALLYKHFISPLFSRSVEARYESYLSNETKATAFARYYLPEEIRNGRGRQAFDLGCGRGRHVALLRQLGYDVLGMDFQSHPYWAKIPGASFLVGTGDSLDYLPLESFDLILCIQVLMYLSEDEGVLSHLRRLLRGGGYLLLQVTNAENLHTALTKKPLAEDPSLQKYYTQAELCRKLAQHDFKIERVWTEKLYLPFIVLPGNLLYEFILSRPLKGFWDKLASPRQLGLINVLARAA